MKIEDFKKLGKDYNKIKKDIDRLAFLKVNNTTMKAVLDNDATHVSFIRPENIDDEVWEKFQYNFDLKSFDDYHYWSDGCLLLFKFAGITAEGC